jgi:riboflavin synthase
MFTGIIETIGEVAAVGHARGGIQLRVKLGKLADGQKIGDSIAVNGVCLTATQISNGEVTFDVGEETARVTTLPSLAGGQRVNIERALTAGSSLGGHFVQGHVDGVARIAGISRRAGGSLFEFSCARELSQQMVAKGSVAVDGISLTLVDVADGKFSVFIIPLTFEQTTLGQKKIGDTVNIETDIIGKYVQRYLQTRATGSGGLDEDKLREMGFA